MRDKIQILVFKKSGKFYTGDTNKWYEIPDSIKPWDKEFEEFVISKEVTNPKGFIFVAIDDDSNKNFYTRLFDKS